jgi:chromosome segregation ATPase
MAEDNGGDLLHERINIRGEIEAIRATLTERENTQAERDKRLDERFEGQEKAVNAALAAAEKAVTAALSAAEKAVEKAENSQQRVNLTQNEFRGTLADQNATTERTMMPRAETELLVKDLRGRIDELSASISRMFGALALAAFAVPILTGVITFLITRR